MAGDDEQPADKGGGSIMERMFGSASCQDGKGLMIVGWIAPATLEEFRQVLSDPTRVQSFADQLKDIGNRMKK